VLAYMPLHGGTLEKEAYANTMLPEGIENVPKRFAIVWRNKWMVLCEVLHNTIYEKQTVM